MAEIERMIVTGLETRLVATGRIALDGSMDIVLYPQVTPLTSPFKLLPMPGIELGPLEHTIGLVALPVAIAAQGPIWDIEFEVRAAPGQTLTRPVRAAADALGAAAGRAGGVLGSFRGKPKPPDDP